MLHATTNPAKVSDIRQQCNNTNPSSNYTCFQSQPNYQKIAKYCNIWRNWDDVQDSWASLEGIIKFYGDDKTKFQQVAGPGNFNDPDMVSFSTENL